MTMSLFINNINNSKAIILMIDMSGDQPWDFFGRNDAKAETPLLGPPHEKASDVGRDWGQEEKGTTEDEMAGWDH